MQPFSTSLTNRWSPWIIFQDDHFLFLSRDVKILRPLHGWVMNVRQKKHHIRECVAKRVKFSIQLPSGSSLRSATNEWLL